MKIGKFKKSKKNFNSGYIVHYRCCGQNWRWSFHCQDKRYFIGAGNIQECTIPVVNSPVNTIRFVLNPVLWKLIQFILPHQNMERLQSSQPKSGITIPEECIIFTFSTSFREIIFIICTMFEDIFQVFRQHSRCIQLEMLD